MPNSTEIATWKAANAQHDGERVRYAAVAGRHEVLVTLLGWGINPNLRNAAGDTAMMRSASERGRTPDCIQALMNAGADVQAVDSHGQNAMMLAASVGNVAILSYLLSVWPDGITSLDSEGNTALLLAAHRYAMDYESSDEDVAVLKVLIDAWPEGVHFPNHGGNTPLMLAAARCHLPRVQLLIDSGAAMSQVNHAGETALDKACDAAGPPEHKNLVVSFLKTSMAAKELRDSIRGYRNAAAATPAIETSTSFLDVL